MHFGNCFCKPHNDVVWPNQHLNPFQIGLCLNQFGSKLVYVWPNHHYVVTNNTFQSAFKGAFTQLRFETGYVNEPLEVATVHFLLETTSQVTVHACE